MTMMICILLIHLYSSLAMAFSNYMKAATGSLADPDKL